MANVRSAGILLWRRRDGGLEVFLAHMGGPLWARKDDAAWSFPKGLLDPGEEELDAALREFGEEIGVPAPDHDYTRLGEQRTKSGKIVIAFAAESEFELADGALHSNLFELEWPPRSGRIQSFPEIDNAEWMPEVDARRRLVASLVPFLDLLERPA